MEKMTFMRMHSFTLIELLIVVAIIVLLISILLPAMSSAREQAAVVKACAELRQISDALEAYGDENYSHFPPMRTYCEMNKRHHWCDLPEELVTSGWLPAGTSGTFLSSTVEDVFNPGHTYKYAAPGWGFHNNSVAIKSVWVPDDFPKDDPQADPDTLSGKSYNNIFDVPELGKPKDDNGRVIPSPVSWVIYSVGPRYDENRLLPEHFPIPQCTWYRGYGTGGVIPRIRTREGMQIGWK